MFFQFLILKISPTIEKNELKKKKISPPKKRLLASLLIVLKRMPPGVLKRI